MCLLHLHPHSAQGHALHCPAQSSAPQTPLVGAPLPDWAAYYRLRGLPPESPAALLMDCVLTIYSALLRLQQQQEQQLAAGHLQQHPQQGQQQGQQRHPLVIHLLGPQKELDQWPLLLELGCLMTPQEGIQLHLIGPDVPAWAHGRSLRVAAPAAAACGRPGCSCAHQPVAAVAVAAAAAGPAAGQEGQLPARCSDAREAGSQTLFFWRGAYHEAVAELAAAGHGSPHVLVAPNSGLAAYPSWMPTLQQLLAAMQRPPPAGSSSTDGPLICCFTDYNEEALHRAQQLLAYLLAGGGISEAPDSDGNSGTGSSIAVATGLNPFRKPAAVLAADNALPAASNGFALWFTCGAGT
jgi:hypothetical protein